MNVNILSCWFKTSYGTYADGLRRGLERRGNEVGVISSNCGCGDPMETNRVFMNDRHSFVELPNVPYWKMSMPATQLVLDGARHVVYHERARRYLKQSGDAAVLHFQQTLNAFGSMAVFKWLAMPSRAARVITIHELDPYQLAHPDVCTSYNEADGVIVHTEEMRNELARLGVDDDRIDVVPHGVEVPPVSNGSREGLVFWAGHKFNASKGSVTLFTALSILKARLGAGAPVVTVHGHYGTTTPDAGTQSAREAGVTSNVHWANEISFDDAVALYQRSLLCVLPFTGSFAGYPASLALATGVPVIGTRRAGLVEHLGDAGSWVDENDPAGLATAIQRLLEDEPERRRIADRGRAHAARELSWDVIAERTCLTYEKALRRKEQCIAS
jgi:glycosyltransferase involved in cell wall biosynthesis